MRKILRSHGWIVPLFGQQWHGHPLKSEASLASPAAGSLVENPVITAFS